MVIKKAYYGKKFAYRCFYAGKLVWDYGVYTGGRARGAWRGIATPKAEALSAIQMHTTATLTGMAVAEVHEFVPVTAHAEASIIGEAFPCVAETVHGMCVASANLRAMGAPSTYGHVFTSGQTEAELAAQALPHAVETVHGAGNVEAELAAVLCPTAEDVQQILAAADATIMASSAPQTQEPERILATVTAKLIATGCPITLPVHTVTFVNNGVELHKASVIEGYNCSDPVTAGEIKVPTKEMTPQYTYDYSGWTRTEGGEADADALTNITADTVIYAAFTASVRNYTITYYDETAILKTESLAYGATPSYVPTKTGYAFDDWYPEVIPVTGDASYYAGWVDKISFSTADWATIAELSESGKASRHFAAGDTKVVEYNGGQITLAIGGFNHDNLTDGSGKAGISIIIITLPPFSSTPYYNWSRLAEYLKNNVKPIFPSDLQSLIKPVLKECDSSTSSGTSPTISKISFELWPLSIDELNARGTLSEIRVSHLGTAYEYFPTNNKNGAYKLQSGDYGDFWIRQFFRIGTYRYYYGSKGGGLTSSTTDETMSKYFLLGFCI